MHIRSFRVQSSGSGAQRTSNSTFKAPSAFKEEYDTAPLRAKSGVARGSSVDKGLYNGRRRPRHKMLCSAVERFVGRNPGWGRRLTCLPTNGEMGWWGELRRIKKFAPNWATTTLCRRSQHLELFCPLDALRTIHVFLDSHFYPMQDFLSFFLITMYMYTVDPEQDERHRFEKKRGMKIGKGDFPLSTSNREWTGFKAGT